MKNQYFGDINDYRKYGILRGLTGSSLSLLICWMLTPHDDRTDGKQIQYFGKPNKYKCFDPQLFDTLQEQVEVNRRRDVQIVEEYSLIPNARFIYNNHVEDSLLDRELWHRELLANCMSTDLVFFDPDNGIEVKSVSKGRKNSSKYIYWDELEQVWRIGASILVYQHFPRKNRDIFLIETAMAFRGKLESIDVVALKTPNVAFILVPQPGHSKDLITRAKTISSNWQGQIEFSLL